MTWGSDSNLGVGETPQGSLVYHADNESYSAESDYVEIYGTGDQRLYAPNASSGSEVTLNTLSARVSPEQNSMRVRVPESANQTNTEFVVEPASVVGDSWTAEYVAGTDGQWYAVVDSTGEDLGAAEKPDPIEVSRDDVGLVSIVPTDPPSTSTDSVGGGIFAVTTTGNLPSLLALFGGVGMLFVAGTRPASSRDAVDAVASSIDSVVSRIPRVGGPLGSAVESAVSVVGSGLVSVGENRLLTGAVGAAIAVAAAEAGLFTIGSETGAILAVAGIAVGSLFLLREAEAFTTARWIAVVAVAGVVALAEREVVLVVRRVVVSCPRAGLPARRGELHDPLAAGRRRVEPREHIVIDFGGDSGLVVAVADDIVPQLVDRRVEREVATRVVEHGLSGGAVGGRLGSDAVLEARIGERPERRVRRRGHIDAHAGTPPVVDLFLVEYLLLRSNTLE